MRVRMDKTAGGLQMGQEMRPAVRAGGRTDAGSGGARAGSTGVADTYQTIRHRQPRRAPREVECIRTCEARRGAQRGGCALGVSDGRSTGWEQVRATRNGIRAMPRAYPQC